MHIYFIVSSNIINGTLKNSIPMCSLLVHKNMIDFYLMACILCPFWTNLLELVVVFYRFLGVLYVVNHVICEYREFYLFSNWYAFYSFSCFILLVRTSDRVAVKMISPDVKWKLFNLLNLGIMLAVGFSQRNLFMLRKFLYSPRV